MIYATSAPIPEWNDETQPFEPQLHAWLKAVEIYTGCRVRELEILTETDQVRAGLHYDGDRGGL